MQELYEEWRVKSKQLKDLKEEEMALRKKICNKILNGMSRPARKTVELAGERVQAFAGVTLKVDEAALNSFFKELTDEDKAALKFKPELVKRAYDKLPATSLVHEAVTEKPAAPTLKIL